MGDTVDPFTEGYFSFPKLRKAIQELEEKQASNIFEILGSIFVKNKTWKDFGLSLVHRDFDVSPAEILVLCINKKAKLGIATPWAREGNLIYPPEIHVSRSRQQPEKKIIEPLNWHFSSFGEAIPFEYLFKNEETDSFAPLCPKFAADVFTTLKEHRLEHLLGLRRIEDIRNTCAWEATAPGVRAYDYVLSYEQPRGLKEEKMLQVAWRFNSEGKLQVGGVLCNNCSQHDDDDEINSSN